MKQTAIQQAIIMVRNRMESMNDTLMGKHTIHHLQQIERGLYDLLEMEKEQMNEAYKEGYFVLPRDVDFKKYYEETYGKK
jgi:predicted DNA binding protein